MSSLQVRRTLSRTSALLLTLPLLAAFTSLPTAAADEAAAPSSRATAPHPGKLKATSFALKNRGFGTKVVGGDLPAGSAPTAFQRIGCTNYAGKTRTNGEAELEVPGLGMVRGVTTTLRTTRAKGMTSSVAVQKVAEIVLADTPLGSLAIKAVRSRAHTFHDGDEFGSDAVTEVGRLVLTPPIGGPQVLPLPAPGDPIIVPGLAEIRVGPTDHGHSRNGAFAKATGLVVKVIPTGTTATVGLARSKMNPCIEDLLFRGSSSGVHATGLDGLLSKGRTPLSRMPCHGTGGETQTKELAGLDLTGAIEVGAMTSQQRAKQNKSGARAFERGTVASIDLGDGALVIEGIVSQANLVRENGRTRFNADGTTLGRVLVDGEPQAFPDTDVLEIPGLARLEAKVVERTKQSLRVVGLRITLLDGTGATIDLGTASIGGKRSGRQG